MVEPLPRFESPPVTEVVIAARSDAAPNYSLLTVAELARRAAASGHSVVEERPGYEAPIERFGRAATSPQVSFEVLAGPPPTRYWFRNLAGDELLQLQPNWVAANWRKVAPSAQYGHWDDRWEAFSKWAGIATEVLYPAGATPRYDQVEVTYVNHIEPNGGWSRHADAEKVFSFLAPSTVRSYQFLGDAEQSSAELHFVIPHPKTTKPVGRLHVAVGPGFRRPKEEPMFVLNLTARGAPLTSGIDGVRQFAEIAHVWIVKAFADLTTPAMHSAWNRSDR